MCRYRELSTLAPKNEEDNIYYYDRTQVLLAGLPGRYHNDNILEEFSEYSGISLHFMPKSQANAKR